MACRCGEIQRCEQDIQLLASSFGKELQAIQEKSRCWTAKMPELSQDLANVIFAANMTRIEMRVAAIKQTQEKRVSAALAKRVSELTRIKSKLSLYENEDNRYHEMEQMRAGR
jgi:hypothetical protein